MALIKQIMPDAVSRLIECLRSGEAPLCNEAIDHDPQVNVSGTAVGLLGEVGSPAAHDALPVRGCFLPQNRLSSLLPTWH